MTLPAHGRDRQAANDPGTPHRKVAPPATTPETGIRRERTPSLADVAARAGVSVSLVSRVLRGDTSIRIREETRRRVHAVAEELGYVPHQLARNLRTSKAGAIGLVVHDVTNPIYAEIIRGAQKAVNRRGSVLLLIDAEAVTDEATLLQIAAGGRVDGLLWQMAGHAELNSRVKVAARHVPVVLVNSRPEAGLPGVYLDDDRAARVAVRHLLDLCHERIGFIGGLRGSDVSERRRAAYRASLTEAGIQRCASWEVDGGWDATSGHDAAARLLKANRSQVTAVLVTNALVATGVVTAAYEMGLRVPEDLSVVAIHDLWFAARLTPPLTVVRLPLMDMGERAVELLHDVAFATGHAAAAASTGSSPRPDGPPDVAIVAPAPHLVTRGSTAPPPALPAR